jgi:acyl homoserine lactone synthase
MIVSVRYENLHFYGKAFHSQFCLRHECFIERQGYNVSEWNNMEFDQYDTPAAIYLVYLSPEGEAWGCSRLTPVSHRSMLKDLWPDLVKQPEKVFTPDTWEGTRFCIKKDIPADLRQRICRELVAGYLEVGLDMGMKKIIGVMPPFIFKRVFINAGCHYEYLGAQMKIQSGDVIVPAAIDITWEALMNVRKISNLQERVVAEEIGELHRRRVA